jgi:manganese/zinc/iron transport system permease protein
MPLIDLVADHTIQNVVAGAVLLGLVSGVLGSFAVLRQQSLLGDTLAHAALPGICLGFLLAGSRELGVLAGGALLTATLAALAVQILVRYSRLKTDAALGSVLSLFFAVGVVLLTFIQGRADAAQGGLESFLFGQAAAILRSDLWLMGGVTTVAVLVVALLWKELKLVTFDPLFAAAVGFPVAVVETALTALVALAVVVGLQMVGVVLMAAMVIAPAVAARQWTRRLEPMVVLAALLGAIAGVAGALISATHPGLATGPLIVLAASAIVLVSLLLAPERGLVWEALKRRRDRRTLADEGLLATLYGLASRHRDPRYPAEQGMLDAFHGVGTRRALARLAGLGMVRRVAHMPSEGAHWELTEAGQRRARAAAERAEGG